MTGRFSLSALLTLGLAGAFGCSSQPTAPSPATGASAVTSSQTEAKGGRAGSAGVVYVTSQGLYYDTFVSRDPLPMQGNFQLIADGQTEFGPGDPEYKGGRWWEDLNGNGMQDESDHYFLCPLLGPGRATP
jgi:hypothetical protein